MKLQGYAAAPETAGFRSIAAALCLYEPLGAVVGMAHLAQSEASGLSVSLLWVTSLLYL